MGIKKSRLSPHKYAKLLFDVYNKVLFTKKELLEFSNKNNLLFPGKLAENTRVGKDNFNISSYLNEGNDSVMNNQETKKQDSESEYEVSMETTSLSSSQEFMMSPDANYVPWGKFTDIKAIVKKQMFYPIFISGLSGNGKTTMVEQVHAVLKRPLIRFNVTIESDEDDFLGGMRLVNGETQFFYGPVCKAMMMGCTLLLDEVDLGSNKMMCLQPVLEGKGVFLKKIGKLIKPQPGFNIIATANTKGQGSDSGKFIGANVLNEAFLDRFAITMWQEYASAKTELNILLKRMEANNKVDETFAQKLVTWGETIRKTFDDEGIEEIVTTRRLIDIVNGWYIYDNKLKAIKYCVERFDDMHRSTFLDLYSKIDEGVDLNEKPEAKEVVEDDDEDEIEF